MIERLIQYQCQKEGSLFYYQSGVRQPYFINRCPICGSSRVQPTGREYPKINETDQSDRNARRRVRRTQGPPRLDGGLP